MEALIESIKTAADAAVVMSNQQNHEGALGALEFLRVVLEEANEYQKIKQRKLEAYLNG